ncbi:reverse gyrase [Thermococcus guaymasensis DSM 11113]|uniref:Reverse gyrase n=1 Tax=Thermococcus guaymasensis DSM 11113 TaxID=1432656 RepID=A0A0X1KI89_9EURY|nr:reverse gyrase [Thermococcus guaymasensis]AJC70975.1 reverse gyrase [Thermococcus guaymasensis DSM 11113]
MKALYREMCPNCEGRISDERLYMRNPCESCLNEPIVIDSYFELVSAVRDALLNANRLKEWEKIYRLESESREIEDFFKKATGFTFWSAQRTWVKRLLKGRSFSIIAPTGMGKSTFGAFMSVYYATKSKKSYIVVPTTPLVIQTIRKVQAIIERTGLDVKLAYYHGNLRKKEKEEMLARIESGDYDILITSAQWLARNFDEKLKGKRFDFIFVDDVDAFLKASKNIDRSLLLLGFTEEIIDKAWEIIRLKKQMSKYLNGRAQDRDERLKELNAQIEKLQREIEEFKRKNDIGIMIIASATGSARGDRIKLYRELLGFEVGSGKSALRNVVDSYLKPSRDVKEHVEELLKRLGKGGLVFVPIDQGLSYAEELVNYLREKGFAVELASSKNKKAVERFENGEADYLVGVATYYGSIVRGLDLPHLIRYAVFTGVPKFRFSIDLERPTIYRALGLLSEIMDFLDDEDRKKAEKLHARLRRLIRNIPQFELLKIEEALVEGLPLENDFHKTVLNVFRELVEFLREVLKKEDVLRRLAEDPFVSLVKEEGKWFIEIPDVRTYIQATGRTSRLFAGGITKGLSVLIVDNEKVFNGLVRQMRWRFTEFKMVPFEELDLDKLLKEIDEDREKVKLVMEGKISSKVKDLVKSALMIVESPNKARTIANFFGRPSKRRIGDLVAYEVSIGNRQLTILASGGHMFDLVTDEGYHGVLIERDGDMLRFIPIYDTIKRCRDCGHQFIDWEKRGVCPRCGSTNVRDALENVIAMRDIAQEVDEILIATDPDTEGEKIAWDIRNILSPYTPNIKRTEFHEVTRPAILKAIEEARDVNENRVEAQIVRRIEDRWIGFELSQELQRVFENRNLSAGRVQTPVLGWIIERYKEFSESEVYFLGLTLENGLQVTVELGKDGKDVEPPEYVTVEEAQVEERELNPAPPYTTDAMLRDASTFLKLSAPETMRLAQDLFEAGLCVTPDTVVTLADGRLVKIEDAVRKGEGNLLAVNGLKAKSAKATKFWEIDWNGPLKIVKLQNGHEIKATPDHGLLVLRDGKLGWVSTKNIKPGDYIAFAYNTGHKGTREYTLLEMLVELGITDVIVELKREYFDSKIAPLVRERIKTSTKYKYLRNHVIPLAKLVEWEIKDYEPHVVSIYRQRAESKRIPNFKLDENFWYVFGLVLGDGTLRDSKVLISQTPLKQVKEILERTFPFLHVFETVNQVGFSNSILAELFRRLGARSGELNPIIFTIPERMLNAMIAGYFDTDGTFSLLHDKRGVNFRAVLSSKRLDVLQRLSVYLYQVGILNYIKVDKRTGVGELIVSNRSLGVFRDKIYPYLRIRRKQFDEAYSEYRGTRKPHESDLIPVGALIKELVFPDGVKARILREEGIDVWNWLKKPGCVPRDKLAKVLKYAEESEVKDYLLSLVEANVTWVKVTDVREEHYTGKLYDFTTTTENFIANGAVSHNCTYHRTDSTHVSSTGIEIAKEYITGELGEQYFKPRPWGEEGTHEAIRPTRPIDTGRLMQLIRDGVIQLPRNLTRNHYRLYDMIFRRFMTSQMVPAKILHEKAVINTGVGKVELEGYVEIIEDGWTKLRSPPMRQLPKLEPGMKLKVIESKKWKAPKVSLYTQGDIIALMKERGIGRPSTYAKIVETLLRRGYVIETKGRKKLVPTEKGIKVYHYLISKYRELVSEEKTRELEEKMDLIEEGRLNYLEVLNELYNEILCEIKREGC